METTTEVHRVTTTPKTRQNKTERKQRLRKMTDPASRKKTHFREGKQNGGKNEGLWSAMKARG